MFFELSKAINKSFPCNYQIGNYILSTDNGWKEIYKNDRKAIIKGYCLEVPLEQAAFEIPQYRGLFCSVAETDLGVLITHGIHRGFNLYQDDDKITNLNCGKLIAHNEFWRSNECEFFDYMPTNLPNPTNVNDALDLIDQYIEENVIKFVKYHQDPIIATITGGLDSSLVYSYLISLNVDHIPKIDRIFEYDKFISNNENILIANIPLLDVISHYRKPTVVTAGAISEFFFLRTPEAMSWIDNYTYESSDYFDLTYNKEKLSELDLIYTINSRDTLIHLGNTLYFNPVLDLRIPLTLMQLPKEKLLPLTRTGEIQKMLIKNRCPWIYDCLPTKKELNPRQKFLAKLFDSY